MDLDRPDYYAPRTDQISREVAPYIIARGLGGVLQGSGKMGVHRLRRIDSP
jgi:hypothetical protein